MAEFMLLAHCFRSRVFLRDYTDGGDDIQISQVSIRIECGDVDGDDDDDDDVLDENCEQLGIQITFR